MIARVAVVLVAVVAVAIAGPERKIAPDKFEKAAGELFAKAVAADDKGDAKAALEMYATAFDLSPHPNIAFNVADLQNRIGRIRDAIASYELYLALAPTAPDRSTIEAVIARLEHAPVTVEISTSAAVDMDGGYVIVDGGIVKQPGVQGSPLHLPPGRHVIDIVTPTTSWSQLVYLDVGSAAVTLAAKPPARLDGSSVISAHDLTVYLEGVPADAKTTRFELSKGHHRVGVSDRGYECPPISFDVPGGADVGYLYVGIVELPVKNLGVGPFHCRKLDVKLLKLAFKS